MQSLMNQGNYQAVINFAGQYAELGFHRDLAYYYLARATAAQGDIQSAYEQLNELLQVQPLWIGGWEMLGEWSGQAADLSTHRVAMAKWHLLRGELKQAEQQALLGTQLSTTNDVQLQQLAEILASIEALTKTAANL